ncbi:helix-turn-helix domain-containing protein [Actinokineospora iranica]|uniref:DNA binding domain-containing protein, excisionase family n=1 Tax=Actinokineospora iranica TaxID=1271860 RepID=A0A1G6P411_9PSEU|nr:helix-turn-helix domain-containing protein [Actinokineospora iranica]SDC74177.1 DNA binding domain-containing protein, excisionase family [Actinokineospora iranica]
MTTQPAGQGRTLLTVEQAAAQLAISRTRMFALIKAGHIHSVRIGRLRRVPLEALAAYVQGLTDAQRAIA